MKKFMSRRLVLILTLCLISISAIAVMAYAGGGALFSASSSQTDAFIKDIANISGLSESSVLKLCNAVGDRETVRENIFVYKQILSMSATTKGDENKVFDLIKQYKPQELLCLYEYANKRSWNYSKIEGMLSEYNNGKSLDEILALSDAGEKYKVYVPADKEKIRGWLDGGYIPEDILAADEIARAKDLLIENVLILKTQNNTWEEVGEKLGYKFEGDAKKDITLTITLDSELRTLSSDNYDDIVKQANDIAKEKDKKDNAKLLDSVTDIDKYEVMGFNINEVQNAIKLSKISGASVDEILDCKKSGQSWEEVIAKYSNVKEADAQ